MTVTAVRPQGATPAPQPQQSAAGVAGNGPKVMADEVRQELQSLAVGMARMEAKLDTLITAKEDHEKRLRVLEAWRWTQLGGAVAVSSAIASAAAKLLGH